MKKRAYRIIPAALAWMLIIFSVILTGCHRSGQSVNESSYSTVSIETVETTETIETTVFESSSVPEDTSPIEEETIISEDGSYTGRDEVAAYIHEYGKLPSNYITKSEAKKLGWDSNRGNLWDVAYGKSIGGDVFGNYEGNLPDEKGRKYYECDIGYEGGYRGAERIIYSNDGLIYYTEDHYKTFELLYGEE